MGDMREISPDLKVKQADVEDLKVLKVQIAVDGSFAKVRFGIEMALRILRLEDVL